MGVGQLPSQTRVVFSVCGESLVKRERALEQITAQACDADRILLPEHSVFADVRQILLDGLLGHAEISLRRHTRDLLLTSGTLDHHGGDDRDDRRRRQTDRPCPDRISPAPHPQSCRVTHRPRRDGLASPPATQIIGERVALGYR